MQPHLQNMAKMAIIIENTIFYRQHFGTTVIEERPHHDLGQGSTFLPAM